MAWTAPMTAVAGNAFTAAQFNVNIRDNLLETAPAKATTATGFFVATGANTIAQRLVGNATVVANEGTTSGTYVDLTTVGPTVTVNTGTRALVIWSAQCHNDTSDGWALGSFNVTGATTISPGDDNSIGTRQPTTGTASRAVVSCAQRWVTLNPGTNIFTMKYKTVGAVGTAFFTRRNLTVIPF